MAFVKHIGATSELQHAPEEYVLVLYGPERRVVHHTRGVTIFIHAPPGISDHLRRLDFLGAVDDAQTIADQMGIPIVYVLLNDEGVQTPQTSN